VNRAAKTLKRLAGLVVSIGISAIGEPIAMCAVALVLILAAVVCWAIMSEERSTRLTALVTAWRSGPRKGLKAKANELPSASGGGAKPKRL
jgi:hypothetical protein